MRWISTSCRADTPPTIRELIGRCLRKKPQQRLQAIGDARIVLEEYLADPEASAAVATDGIPVAASVPRWRRLMPWAVAAGLAVALGGLLWSVSARTPQVISATIPPPADAEFYLNPNSPGPVAVSPDGRSIAFSAQDLNGDILLYVRRLDAPQAQALSGTDNAAYPFWSPDSRWIGYFNRPEGTLKKIDTNGGPPVTLTQAPNGKGGTWNEDGVIVFAPDASTPLHRVSSAGGQSEPVTEIDGEVAQLAPASALPARRAPGHIPGPGQHPATESLLVTDLEGGATREVMATDTQAEYASGHLLFVRERALMAQPFDPGTAQFEGEAVPLAEDVLTIQGASLADFSLSDTGILSFATGRSEEQTQLEWRDRAGDDGGTVGDEAPYRTAVLSPDGTLAIAEVIDEATGTQDLWVFDIERGLRTRFTFDPAQDIWPVWSPDGRTIYFASNRQGNFGIYKKSLEGAGEVEEVVRTRVTTCFRPAFLPTAPTHGHSVRWMGPGPTCWWWRSTGARICSHSVRPSSTSRSAYSRLTGNGWSITRTNRETSRCMSRPSRAPVDGGRFRRKAGSIRSGGQTVRRSSTRGLTAPSWLLQCARKATRSSSMAKNSCSRSGRLRSAVPTFRCPAMGNGFW